MEQLNSKSLEELSNLIADKEKALRTAMENSGLVEMEELKISRSIVELQLKKKDIQMSITKAKYNVSIIKSELREITQSFWNKKNGG